MLDKIKSPLLRRSLLVFAIPLELIFATLHGAYTAFFDAARDLPENVVRTWKGVPAKD